MDQNNQAQKQSQNSSSMAANGPMLANRNGNLTSLAALSIAMASVHGLLFKTFHAHWNSKGSCFLAVHEFTKKNYAILIEELDLVAERIRALDGMAPTDHATLSSKSILKEDHVDIYDALKLSRHLADSHHDIERQYQTFIKQLDDEDPVTADMFTGLAKTHGKLAWMYKAMMD